jgi:IclR family KDG regulon transcriptional repressor
MAMGVSDNVASGEGVSLTQDVKARLDSTIVKGMRVIETLAQSPKPLGVTELARTLGLHKSNAHRILNTLTELGYVQKEQGTSLYHLSLKAWEIGCKIINRNSLRRAARPLLRQLSEETAEVVFLAVLNGIDILYLDAIDAVYPLQSGIQTGWRVPAAFPASGRALLAHQPNPEQLLARTVRTVPQAASLDVPMLLEEFEKIRRCGFAITIGGWTTGRNSIAAPITSGGRPPLAAVGVGGPTDRLGPERLSALSKSVLNAATRIAETFGSDESAHWF